MNLSMHFANPGFRLANGVKNKYTQRLRSRKVTLAKCTTNRPASSSILTCLSRIVRSGALAPMFSVRLLRSERYERYMSFYSRFISFVAERGKRKRMEESASRRRDYQERFASGMASRYRNRGNADTDNGEARILLSPESDIPTYTKPFP